MYFIYSSLTIFACSTLIEEARDISTYQPTVLVWLVIRSQTITYLIYLSCAHMRSKVMHLVMSVCVRTYYTYVCTHTCMYINKNKLLHVLSLAKIIVIYYLLFEMPLVWFAMSSKLYRQSKSSFST